MEGPNERHMEEAPLLNPVDQTVFWLSRRELLLGVRCDAIEHATGGDSAFHAQ